MYGPGLVPWPLPLRQYSAEVCTVWQCTQSALSGKFRLEYGHAACRLLLMGRVHRAIGWPGMCESARPGHASTFVPKRPTLRSIGTLGTYAFTVIYRRHMGILHACLGRVGRITVLTRIVSRGAYLRQRRRRSTCLALGCHCQQAALNPYNLL